MAVIIKPQKGSKKFYKNAKQFQKVVDVGTGQDTGDYQEAGEYSGERFPNSKQRPRIPFSQSKRRWLLYTGTGDEYTKEELNELVKSCNLTFVSGPKKGSYITEADVSNLSDPFFNHPHLSALLKEGSSTMNPEVSAQEKIMISGLRAHRQFKEAGKNSLGLSSAGTKYIITDKETDTTLASKGRENTLEAVRLYDALSDKRRAIIARILGLRVRKDTDRAIIDDKLFKMAMNDKTLVKDGSVSEQDMFISLCKTDPEDLQLKDLIARAKGGGLLRKTKEGWTFRGVKIGRTVGAVETYFSSAENQESLISLEQALEDADK